MEIKVRPLNSNEKYACNPRDIKSIFRNDENVYISFGHLYRDFNFDTKDKNRPNIKGIVIAKGSVNKRDGIRHGGFICFYVIKDSEYDEEKKDIFIKNHLPLMYKWHQEVVKTETLTPGIEMFLVEWVNNDFKTYCYRYH